MGNNTFQYETIDQSSGFILFKLNAVWKEQLEVIFRHYELTQTQYAILASLMWFDKEGKKLTQQELATHLKIEKMTLSKAIRPLEQKKYISRLDNKEDSRSYLIGLLSAGRSVTQKAIHDVEKLDEKFFNVLPKNERTEFNQFCLKLINGQDHK